MDSLIILVGAALVFGVPVGLVASAIIGSWYKVAAFRIIAGLLLSLFAHLLAISILINSMFFVAWSGAHNTEPENALSWCLRVAFLLIELLYGASVFSVCTFLVGRAKPWPFRIHLP